MDVFVTLPVAFSVRDHHEFQSHRDMLQRLHPSIVVREAATGVHVKGGPTVYWGVVCMEDEEISETDLIDALGDAGYDFAHNGKNFKVEV